MTFSRTPTASASAASAALSSTSALRSYLDVVLNNQPSTPSTPAVPFRPAGLVTSLDQASPTSAPIAPVNLWSSSRARSAPVPVTPPVVTPKVTTCLWRSIQYHQDTLTKKRRASQLAASQLAASQLAASQLAASQLAARQLAAQQEIASQLAASQLAASQLAASQLAASQLAASQLAASQVAASQLAFQQAAASQLVASLVPAHVKELARHAKERHASLLGPSPVDPPSLLPAQPWNAAARTLHVKELARLQRLGQLPRQLAAAAAATTAPVLLAPVLPAPTSAPPLLSDLSHRQTVLLQSLLLRKGSIAKETDSVVQRTRLNHDPSHPRAIYSNLERITSRTEAASAVPYPRHGNSDHSKLSLPRISFTDPPAQPALFASQSSQLAAQPVSALRQVSRFPAVHSPTSILTQSCVASPLLAAPLPPPTEVSLSVL
jgi:hypothetical protein